MSGQLAFDLPSAAAYRRDDFFASPANQAALAAVEMWQGGKLVLIGPRGAGKTHLAHIWAERVGAVWVSGRDLTTVSLPDLAAQGAVVVDDADAVAGHAEAALFHLHNLIEGGHLLLTATTPPRDWGLGLADLTSRMQAIPVARLQPPDDALLSAVLVKLFADRQVIVPANLIAYLVTRMERSFASARDLVAVLDRRALALGRPISRTLAAEVLDSQTLG